MFKNLLVSFIYLGTRYSVSCSFDNCIMHVSQALNLPSPIWRFDWVLLALLFLVDHSPWPAHECETWFICQKQPKHREKFCQQTLRPDIFSRRRQIALTYVPDSGATTASAHTSIRSRHVTRYTSVIVQSSILKAWFSLATKSVSTSASIRFRWKRTLT